MAGHSKWANIKHKKAKTDAKRGKAFTKLIRELVVAASMGGDDAESNPRLRAAIDNARSQNMTKDTINRAIVRGTGGQEGQNMVENRYEGYGPHGVAVLVDTLTDNRNRTVAEVRHAFGKGGGNLGASGSVAYQFDHVGVLSFNNVSDEDALMALALELGAEDFNSHTDGMIDVVTQASDYFEIVRAMEQAGFTPMSQQTTWMAQNPQPLGAASAEQVMTLVDLLEDLDDVQAVYTNAELADSSEEKTTS